MRKIEGSAGIISSAKTDEREFKITVRSGHDRPIKVVIEDQLPVSEIEDIKVEMLPVTTPPTERDVRDRRGVLAWNFDAAPGEAREIKLGWRMRWPADKAVVYEPRRAMSRARPGRADSRLVEARPNGLPPRTPSVIGG